MWWIGAFLLGNVIWLVITIIAGFVFVQVGGEYQSGSSNYYNFILYPLSLFLGFKITKTPFLGAKKEEQ